MLDSEQTQQHAWLHRAAVESIFGLRLDAHSLRFMPLSGGVMVPRSGCGVVLHGRAACADGHRVDGCLKFFHGLVATLSQTITHLRRTP